MFSINVVFPVVVIVPKTKDRDTRADGGINESKKIEKTKRERKKKITK